MAHTGIPPYHVFMNPIIVALRDLGGSGTIAEIDSKVAGYANLPEDQFAAMQQRRKGGQTEYEYRLAWARHYLKRVGIIDNSVRGVWALTAKGRATDRVDEKQIVRQVHEQLKKGDKSAVATDIETAEVSATWRDQLQGIVMALSPAAFERLAQRLLRESGFMQVEVTGRSGDGGIDGQGIIQLGGLLSFHVIFQCKRWQGAVRAKDIRDFRGAMVGRADKALFITTGAFTKDAIQEATRDGAPAIDLIDGDRLFDKLKDLSLGVETRSISVEQVTVNPDWFAAI
jgi:restriction system protein